MKKLLNFLLVRRPETENKWWHRLFTVLLFGSGIVVCILTILLISLPLTVGSDNHSWTTYRPVAFSLESNYQKASGKEFSCHNDLFAFNISDTEPVINGEGIKCDGVVLSELDSKRYSTLYRSAEKNLEKQYGLDKYFDTSTCPPSANKNCEFDIVIKGSKAEQADPSYGQYQTDLKDLARIKVARDINFRLISSDIALWSIIPLFVSVLWITFWGSIIYRSILYVVFGKEKNG